MAEHLPQGLTQLANSGFNEKLRVLELPQGDWAASSFRPLLERMLNDGAFTGTDEEYFAERAYIEETFKPLVLKCKELNRMIRIGTLTTPPTAPQPLAHDSPQEVGR